MTYFFDNCISPRFPKCLSALGVSAKALQDVLSPDTPDIEVFKSIAGRDVVFVSADMRQLRVASERLALKSVGCTAIYFAPFWVKMPFWEQAAWLVAKWRTIQNFVESATAGTVGVVQRNGKVSPEVL